MYSSVITPLPLARWYIRQVVDAGDCVLDCTAGNGHDTVFLAELVGRTGRVFAFDIQEQAIAETIRKLAVFGYESRVKCIQDSHIHVDKYVDVPVKAAMFNLGYLPGGNHRITTRASITKAALGKVLDKLAPGGIATVVVYPGHPEGKQEDQELVAYVDTLDKRRFAVMVGSFLKSVENPPRLIAIQKGMSEANESGVQR